MIAFDVREFSHSLTRLQRAGEDDDEDDYRPNPPYGTLRR